MQKEQNDKWGIEQTQSSPHLSAVVSVGGRKRDVSGRYLLSQVAKELEPGSSRCSHVHAYRTA